MKILLVDDYTSDRELFLALLTGGDPPWLRGDDVVVASAVPPLNRLFAEFDGMIIDQDLKGSMRGSDYAIEIHALNWEFPVILLTGEPRALPPNILDYCDGVLSKDTSWPEFSGLNPMFGIRRWIRSIARVHAAVARGAKK